MSDPTIVSDGVMIGGQNGYATITSVAITTTAWTLVPTAALKNRNAIAIQNNNAASVYLSFNDTATAYWNLGSGKEISFELKYNVELYAKGSVSGQSVICLEISHK